MIVRRADVDDASAIAGVHVRSWKAAYRGHVPASVLEALDVDRDAKAVRQHLLGSPAPFRVYVAEAADARITGFVYVGRSRDEDADTVTGEVASLYVDPRSWRSGIGQALLEAALDDLSDQGCTTASLWVLEDNDIGRAFYEGRGWRDDGARKTVDLGSVQLTEVRYRFELVPS